MKKIVSVLLAFAICLSLLPMVAFAGGEPSYDNTYFVSYDGCDEACVELPGEGGPTHLDSLNWGDMAPGYEFTVGQDIQFFLTPPSPDGVSIGKPYAVSIVNMETWESTSLTDSLEGESAPYSVWYRPETSDGFMLQVYWTQEQFEYDQCHADEGQIMVEFCEEGNGTVDYDHENAAIVNQKQYHNMTRVVLTEETSSFALTALPAENEWLNGIWVEQDQPQDVDFAGDGRYVPDTGVFTLSFTGDAYDNQEGPKGKFVNVRFNFSGGPEGGTGEEYNNFGPTEELPYLIEFHWYNRGNADVVGEFEHITDGNNTKVRVANTTGTISFDLHPDQDNSVDGIRVEQEGTDGNIDGFVDLATDTRYNEGERTFSIDLTNEKYNDPEIAGYKFVNISFDFTNNGGEPGGEPGNNNIEVFFPDATTVNGNTVTFSVGDPATLVTVTVAGADIEDTGDGYKVAVPRNNSECVTFTVDDAFDPQTMEVAIGSNDGFRAALTLDQKTTNINAHNGGNPDVLNFAVEVKGGNHGGNPGGDPEPTWYTVSWAGGNVTVENGQVIAERVHIAAQGEESAKTYTIHKGEVNEANNIFDLWETIGKEKEHEEDPDSLQLYGMGFSQSDLFIDGQLEGVSIDFKFLPNYGYQLKNIYTNEEEKESCLNDFKTDDENISTFTFDVIPGNNVHFCVYFEKGYDTVQTTAENISGASILNGGNAAASGNLSMTVAGAATDTTIPDAVSTFDITLDNIVSKGENNGNWTKNITEFDEPITVTLNLDTSVYNEEEYRVVRQHGTEKEVLETTYDAATGQLTFRTNKFSSYTIIKKAEGSVTAPTAITNLQYTGNAQALINAGSSATGTIKYKLGTDGIYGTEIPTATEAGTYTVYYMVTGDADHKDVPESSVQVTIADKTAPTGEIVIKTNTFKSFLNTITFGLLYKENQDVSITAADEGTGVKSIAYLVSDTALTIDQVKASTKWADYSDPFGIATDGKYVIYARITDRADNVAYISSDGIVLDQTAPTISGIADGTVYYTTQKFTVEDTLAGIKEVTIDGVVTTDYTLAGNVDKDYVVVVTDNALNSTTYQVTMKAIASLDNSIETLTENTVKSTNQSAITDVKTSVGNIVTTNATPEESAALKAITDTCDALLQKIGETVNALTAAKNAADGYTVTAVKSSDKTAIESAKTAADKISADNLTDAEKVALKGYTDHFAACLICIDDTAKALKAAKDASEVFSGDNLKMEDKENIQKAIEDAEAISVENLTKEEAGKLASYLEILSAAKASIEEMEAIQDEIGKMNKVEALTLADEKSVNELYESYHALSENEKALFDQDMIAKLEAAKKTVDVLHRQSYTPEIIEGANQTIDVAKGDTAAFRSEAPFAEFVKLMVDGKAVESKYYDVKEGSTIVTIKKEFLDTLSNGKHEMSIVSVNGHADCEFTITGHEAAPIQTGDNSRLVLWITLLAASVVTASAMIYRKKRSER